ncbi:MAG: GT2 family glycosyltransferase [Planctomycetota bacterium]|jgi:GT2 family glycosyltransferase
MARVSHPDVRLSALVVNFNSGAFAVRCVETLIADWLHDGRRREDLEVVVVDNASPVDQENFMLQLEELGAHVVRHDENGGYSKGMNLAYSLTSGGPRDLVAILNPDLYFWPGALSRCMDYVLDHQDCGVVTPKAFIDHGQVLQLPRNTLPTLADHCRTMFAQLSPSYCRAYSRRRVKVTIPWWESEGAIDSDMLSGCCLFLRREVVDELPALMDERYPLYYEDTDLFRQLTARGYRLVCLGTAKMLHHWSRSAGIENDFNGEPMKRYRVSQVEYFRKFNGPLGLALVKAVNWICASWPQKYSFRPMHPIQELGNFDGPVAIQLPRHSEYLLELTMAPTWLLAVGILGEGDRWECPAETWEWFFHARYFMRAIDRKTGEFLGAWSFQKTVEGRYEPLELSAGGWESNDSPAAAPVSEAEA